MYLQFQSYGHTSVNSCTAWTNQYHKPRQASKALKRNSENVTRLGLDSFESKRYPVYAVAHAGKIVTKSISFKREVACAIAYLKCVRRTKKTTFLVPGPGKVTRCDILSCIHVHMTQKHDERNNVAGWHLKLLNCGALGQRIGKPGASIMKAASGEFRLTPSFWE